MTKELFIKMVLDAWNLKVNQLTKLFDQLTDEQLEKAKRFFPHLIFSKVFAVHLPHFGLDNMYKIITHSKFLWYRNNHYTIKIVEFEETH